MATTRNLLAELTAAIPALPERRQEFAASLIVQARRGRALSDNQWSWVEKLIDMAAAPKPAAPAAVDVGSVQGVLALMRGAKVKHPKIRLQLGDTRPVVLSIAGERARFPGTINVTSGHSFGDPEGVFYGRVTVAGMYEPSAKAGATATAVAALLSHLGANPAEVAKVYGRVTGHCCFCARALDDKRSIEVGYGPTCAANYSLPWGEK